MKSPLPQSKHREGAEAEPFGLEMNVMSSTDTDTTEQATAPLIARDAHDQGTAAQEIAKSSGNVFIWTLTISSGVSGLLFGYDTGVISSTLVSIGTDLSSRPLTTLDKSLITSCTSLFALAASPVAGVLADRLGRKNVIVCSDALFVLGAICQALSSQVWVMIIGRSLVGAAIGGASLVTPLYVGELAPGHLRGRLVTVLSFFITGGQVVAYVIGWLLSDVSNGWRWMVGLGAAPALLQLALLLIMPESPRFLVQHGNEKQARDVLRKVFKGTYQDHETAANDVILAIKRDVLAEEEAEARLKASQCAAVPPVVRSLLFHPPHARALVIACLLQALQQLCGFNSLMYFSASIFDSLHFSSPTLTSLSVAITNFAFTIVAFYLIDRLGRRKILLLTIPIMVLGLLLCALAFTYIDASDFNRSPADAASPASDSGVNSRLPAVGILVSLILYIAAYASGLGVVPWQQSELFPLSVRSLGSSISTATNWGSNTIVGLTFLPLMQLITPGWTFVSYAVVCAAGWICVWQIYPETAGLDLEDVSELLQDGWGVSQSVDRHRRRRNSVGFVVASG